MNPPILQVYKALFEKWGPQFWWPADSRLEMMIGAILTQNTAWTNVEKALNNLRSENVIHLDALRKMNEDELVEQIRPAGYYNQKSRYIKEMVKYIANRFDGDLEQLFALETKSLRTELLSWTGIGPETADSIILYAAEKPVFVVDTYTKRVCTRHGWIPERASYDAVSNLFTTQLKADVQLFNEYHALLVKLCKEHCKTKPVCQGCPLESFLPRSI